MLRVRSRNGDVPKIVAARAMRCPACQSENASTASVCVKCGAKLPLGDFSDAALGTIYEVSAGTGGEPTGISSTNEEPTMQV